MMAIPDGLELISSQVIILNSVETECGPLFLYKSIPSRLGLDQRTFLIYGAKIDLSVVNHAKIFTATICN